MRKILLTLTALALVAVLVPSVGAEDEAQSFTGEIIDVPCYVAQGAEGSDHAGCAKSCVKNGQPMGLKSGDTLYLLAADHKDGSAYAGLKEHAGETVEISGVLHERDGMKVITVTGAAS